jgi:putative ABC transport system substrate-binding protein
MFDMRRREFFALLGGAATWPLVARAQPSAMPVIGLLSGGTPEAEASNVSAFRQGLGETGYVEGRNVAFEFRWAEGHYDRLPALAAELVRSQVAVIVALGPTLAALAAKAASPTIPIVFFMGADPVKVGLVASLNRPGGNVTGVSVLFNVMVAKQLELLHETVPRATSIGVLVNPANSNATSDTGDAQAAARALGQNLMVVHASAESDLEIAFATMAEQRVGALLVAADVFFRNRVAKLAALATRHRLPMLCPWRECAAAGGLMSYGATQADGYRQEGVYTGRILKGEKPADLPVLQPTRFDFVLNLKTARAFGLTVPLTLQAAADEVME